MSKEIDFKRIDVSSGTVDGRELIEGNQSFVIKYKSKVTGKMTERHFTGARKDQSLIETIWGYREQLEDLAEAKGKNLELLSEKELAGLFAIINDRELEEAKQIGYGGI